MRIIKNIEELNKQVGFIQNALQNVDENNRLSNIEYDIILEKLRFIYEELQASDSEEMNGSSVNCNDEILEKTQAEENIPLNMDDLLEKPFISHPAVDKSIIESLYGEEEYVDAPDPKENHITETDISEENPMDVSSQVLNERLAGNPVQDVASMLSAQACSQLRNKIGLNDRLMLLNDLFDNDPDLYERTLDALESADSLDDAYIYLSEHFALDNEKEGVKLLISLLEAKFN